MRQNLDALRSVYSGRVLWEDRTAGSNKLQLTDLGRELLETSERMVHEWEGLSRLGDDVAAVAFLPQHSFFMSPMIRELKSPESRIRPHVLGEHDCDMEVFESHVIGSLRAGAVDLVVGPPAQDLGSPSDLEETLLYESRIEAMVPQSEPGTSIDVADLLKRPLLVSPPSTRSRAVLAAAMASEGIPVGALTDQIALEAYGTKVLVTFAHDGHGVVVVPSDIAYPFKDSHLLSGPDLEGFKWIPVSRGGASISHRVVATTRVPPHDLVARIVKDLQARVAPLGLDVGAMHL